MNTYIFDFDGTLVNSITTIAYFANKALNKFGLPSISEERYKILVGNGAVSLVKRMLKEVGADQSMFDKVYPEYWNTYDKNFSYLTEPYEGIIEMLKKLKENNCN
ncbi:MAG: HAD hydrolase-like protein, partial [Clostridia bacterium]|nr:HAD hydrolase-like protein [Clostridia bacterium]